MDIFSLLESSSIYGSRNCSINGFRNGSGGSVEVEGIPESVERIAESVEGIPESVREILGTVRGILGSVGGILGSVVRSITLTSGSVTTSMVPWGPCLLFLAAGGLVAFVPLDFFLQLFGSGGGGEAGGGVGVLAPTYSCSVAFISSLEPEI